MDLLPLFTASFVTPRGINNKQNNNVRPIQPCNVFCNFTFVVLVRARLRRALLRFSLSSLGRDKFLFFAPQILVCLFSDSLNVKFIRACKRKDFPAAWDLNHWYLLYLSAG